MCHTNRMILSLATAIIAMTMLAAQAYAQDNPYRIEEGWAKLPEGRKWGATIGVEIDRDGNIWVVRAVRRKHLCRLEPARRSSSSTLRASLEDVRRGDVQSAARFPHRPGRQRLGERRDRQRWQGPPGIQVQPGRKGADDARQGGSRRRRARHFQSARRTS